MSFLGNTVPPKQDDYGGDEISALVLDPGSSTTRAGFAGEDTPKSVVSTYYGRTPSIPHVFGDESLSSPLNGLEILNPMAEDGTVEDWDAAQKLWEYSIKSRLVPPRQLDPSRNGLNDIPKEENGETKKEDGTAMDIDGAEDSEIFLEEYPLLMSEPAWNPVKNREKSIEIALESWGAPAFWTARSGVLAAFASGKSSALIVDVGARSTSITPIHDGLILRKGALRSPLGGDFISNQLRLQFANNKPQPITLNPTYLVTSKVAVEAGQPALATYRSFSPENAPHPSFRRLQEEKILHEFKECVVEVWSKNGRLSAMGGGGLTNEEHARNEPPRPFEFPDGYNQIFTSEQFRAAEGLFDVRAALTSEDSPAPDPKFAIPAMIQQSLNQVDIDTRTYLMSNVVVTGAGSLLRGFTERLNLELQAMYSGPKLRVTAPGNLYERRFASWIGGSILASLGTFHQMWISKKEYEEMGASIVEKRCK